MQNALGLFLCSNTPPSTSGGDITPDLEFDFIGETYTLNGATVDPLDYMVEERTIDAGGLDANPIAAFNETVTALVAGDFTIVLEVADPATDNVVFDVAWNGGIQGIYIWRWEGEIDFYNGNDEEFSGDWSVAATPMRISFSRSGTDVTMSANGAAIEKYTGFTTADAPTQLGFTSTHVRYLAIYDTALADADLPALSA